MIETIKTAFEEELENMKSQIYERIAEYVLQRCRENTRMLEAVAKAVGEKKNISGAVGEMRKVAQEKAVNGVGCLTDEEGFGIVMKYFGVEEEAQETVSLFDLI